MARQSYRNLKGVSRSAYIVRMTHNSIDWDEAMTRYLHGYVQLVLCYVAGIIYPSLLTIFYLVGSLMAIVAIAFGASIFWLEMM